MAMWRRRSPIRPLRSRRSTWCAPTALSSGGTWRRRSGASPSTGRYTIKRFELFSRQWTRIILTEGKNREIRRIFEAFGYEIKELIRLRVGCIELDNLKVGHWRTIRREEIRALLRGETEPLRWRREGRW